jgi:acyl dehydratase
MKKNKIDGNFFEDFIVGQEFFHSYSKTIFESDNNFFSLITMNHHPVHINLDYSKKNHHGEILVVGTLVFSLVVGMSVSDISKNAVANLSYDNIKHIAPVFINDTIYAKSKIIKKKILKEKKNQGLISVQTIAFNQNNKIVLSFKRTVLIKKKNYKINK